MCVCVCARAIVRVRACARVTHTHAPTCVCVCVHMCVRVCASSRARGSDGDLAADAQACGDKQQAWDDNWEGIYALSEVIMQNTIKSYMAK